MKFYFYLVICSLFSAGCQDQSNVESQVLIPYKNKGLGPMGYRSQKTGDIVIEPKYDAAGKFLNKIDSVKIGVKKDTLDDKLGV